MRKVTVRERWPEAKAEGSSRVQQDASLVFAFLGPAICYEITMRLEYVLEILGVLGDRFELQIERPLCCFVVLEVSGVQMAIYAI